MKDEALEPINFAELHPDWKRLYLSSLPKLPLADVLAQFQPEDVLAQFNPKDIENYLTRLKQSPRATTAKAKAKTRKKGVGACRGPINTGPP
jgi:hypothetical protein